MSESTQGQSHLHELHHWQNKIKLFFTIFPHQPFSTSVTGCATSRIYNSYLGCHLKRHLVPQFNWQVTTGGNFLVWTMPLSLTAAGNTRGGFLLLFCCILVVLSKCKVLVRRIISLVSRTMSGECNNICLHPKNPSRRGLGEQEEEENVACI